MYATAHRVISPGNQTGINAFLHTHDEEAAKSIDWQEPDLEYITNQKPGKLVAESIGLTPGGNSVRSYLDIVCRDETDPKAIIDALLHMEAGMILGEGSVIQRFQCDVVVGFGHTFGLRDVRQVEYKELRQVLEKLVRERYVPAWMNKEPLIIRTFVEGDQMVFRLDSASRERVAKANDVHLPKAIIRVDVLTLDLFNRQYGDLIRHILPLVTDLPLEKLRQEGGARVINQEDKTIWEWPQRSP